MNDRTNYAIRRLNYGTFNLLMLADFQQLESLLEGYTALWEIDRVGDSLDTIDLTSPLIAAKVSVGEEDLHTCVELTRLLPSHIPVVYMVSDGVHSAVKGIIEAHPNLKLTIHPLVHYDLQFVGKREDLHVKVDQFMAEVNEIISDLEHGAYAKSSSRRKASTRNLLNFKWRELQLPWSGKTLKLALELILQSKDYVRKLERLTELSSYDVIAWLKGDI